MKVKSALNVAILARLLKVRGIEAANEITAVMAEKPMVQRPCPVMVFHHLAPTRQCRPIMNVSRSCKSNAFSALVYRHLLFKRNMTAVK